MDEADHYNHISHCIIWRDVNLTIEASGVKIFFFFSFFLYRGKVHDLARFTKNLHVLFLRPHGTQPCLTWKGKIGQLTFYHNLCNTTENLTLPFKSDFANEMTCCSWYSYVQTCNLPYKNVSIVFSCPYNIFITIFKDIVSVLYVYFMSQCTPREFQSFNCLPCDSAQAMIDLYATGYICVIGAVAGSLISYMGNPGLCPRSGIQAFRFMPKMQSQTYYDCQKWLQQVCKHTNTCMQVSEYTHKQISKQNICNLQPMCAHMCLLRILSHNCKMSKKDGLFCPSICVWVRITVSVHQSTVWYVWYVWKYIYVESYVLNACNHQSSHSNSFLCILCHDSKLSEKDRLFCPTCMDVTGA